MKHSQLACHCAGWHSTTLVLDETTGHLLICPKHLPWISLNTTQSCVFPLHSAALTWSTSSLTAPMSWATLLPSQLFKLQSLEGDSRWPHEHSKWHRAQKTDTLVDLLIQSNCHNCLSFPAVRPVSELVSERTNLPLWSLRMTCLGIQHGTTNSRTLS